MLLIVEGVDRTGKSSLCKVLHDRFEPSELLHFAAPGAGAIDEYVKPLLSYVPGNGHVFVDRHYLGETVWPALFDRESRMSNAEQYCIELFLKSRGALCLWAWRDPDDLETACADEPCSGLAATAQHLFARSIAASTLTWTTYTHGDDVERIVGLAREQEYKAASWYPGKALT